MTGEALQIEQLFGVKGKSAVVTGGASGLGLGIARALAANGAKVAVIDRNPDAVASTVSELGGEASGVVADITEVQSISRALDEIDAARGGIDILFANAGIGGEPGFGAAPEGQNPAGTIDGCPDAEWRQVIDVNLNGTRNTLAATARLMKARGHGGKIVITSSCAALLNVPFVSTAYHAAKAGTSHLGRQLAVELAPHDIRVNIISPANFVTNIGGGSMQLDSVKALFGGTSLLNRVAELHEIAGLALFLASDASSYVTGVEIPVDGGSLLAGRHGG